MHAIQLSLANFRQKETIIINNEHENQNIFHASTTKQFNIDYFTVHDLFVYYVLYILSS